jgi:hypothetical protein
MDFLLRLEAIEYLPSLVGQDHALIFGLASGMQVFIRPLRKLCDAVIDVAPFFYAAVLRRCIWVR